mmetsp:Transcript_1814/g.3459  ORF Transcript_1814/g.3459 Transcript_1814/m.3459 type:complete len:182 (-) Transcript_1814:152-697(-)|eukprot:CAMPEP_0196665250 /NCGR_PEP_ID=MMETSP1086-20130531/60105_1 /TAXON_ID=77921 /ORGANISM="Cyanoptyche  gloeocystis , Strain SAG4.97" /LENGTH=181 /DNA_ID=CAMNT_0042001895 /DNA_START=29 /DNA_END=574 /DNA_ORIENTATION=+
MNISLLVAAVLLAFGSGFLVGNKMGQRRERKPRDPKESDDDFSEADDDDCNALGLTTKKDPRGEYKLVLCVRQDLGMGKGKIAAQCCHATLGIYKKLSKISPDYPALRIWEHHAQPKIALKVKDEEELNQLRTAANALNLPTIVIHDAGRTQIAAGSATVLAIGPASVALIDEVTGHLKLL